MTTPRATELVETLGLLPHPEGGWFREVFRSATSVAPPDGRGPRNALTAIYFLLDEGQQSRWHRVRSDEAWAHLEGVPLDLWQWDAATGQASCSTLGPVSGMQRPQAVVPAGLWQAARPQPGGHTLVASMVGPGFNFADFSLMDTTSPEATRIRQDWPALAGFI